MISVMVALLASVTSQSATVAAPPQVIMTPLPKTQSNPAPALSARARAMINLPMLFSTDDYPAAALRNEEQGTVAFTAVIDRDGRVSDCDVTTSSGSASLDSTTCAIIKARARFGPARDLKGGRSADSVSAKIRWMLPVDPPMPFADEKTAIIFTTNATGEVVGCRVAGNAPQSPARICDQMMPAGKRIVAAQRGRVGFVSRELILEEGVLVGGPEAARSVGRGRGEMLGMMVAVALDIDAAGAVSRCIAADGNNNGEGASERCRVGINWKFVALDPAESDRSERRAVRYWASYTRPIA